jgi:hypothetical protein
MFNTSFVDKVMHDSNMSVNYSNHTSLYVVHANQSKMLLENSVHQSKDFSKISGIIQDVSLNELIE